MNNPSLIILVFIAGAGAGWLARTMSEPVQSQFELVVAGRNQPAENPGNNSSATAQTLSPAGVKPGGAPDTPQAVGVNQRRLQQFAVERSSRAISQSFQNLLDDRLYFDAMTLYQEQVQQDPQSAIQLKKVLLDRLDLLSKDRNNSDFSELIDNYLAVYFDDIDVLLVLAEFNQANGSYLEAVDVYLLAKTYAYTEVEQQKLLARFNDFTRAVDNLYSNAKNWLPLINFYSHINASGLMTSPHQYRQAIAHLRSGDEYFAVEQFKQLLNDSLVGESAAIALNNLTESAQTPPEPVSPVADASETIALEKRGNQYLVDLTVNRRDDVKLLIDTGASITTLSRASFDTLTTGEEAEIVGRRVFRTAGGVIMGTVYSVPELRLGSYVITNSQIAVIDFDTSRGFDGLLGMNVLGQFRFQIDQDNAKLLLSSK